jgi:hypothetical protein
VVGEESGLNCNNVIYGKKKKSRNKKLIIVSWIEKREKKDFLRYLFG